MKLAFVDLAFSWPPPGGAQADLYHTIAGLQAEGHEVRLFAPTFSHVWRFGSFNPADLAFPSTPIPVAQREMNRHALPKKIRAVVDAWVPEAVFLGFGRFMKPYVMEALLHYPMISRYYMYEPLCIRDLCLWKEKQTCPNDFLHTPDACRRCTVGCWSKELASGAPSQYGREYYDARTFTPAYHRLFTDTLSRVQSAVVNNDLIRARMEGFCPDVRVIPGGVHVDEFAMAPLRERSRGRDKKIILMTGRVDDPLKGAETLIDAGRGLSAFRSDFEVWITGNDPQISHPWLRQLGWLNHQGIVDVYRQADICVVPSVWQEPFGLVAVEGAAAGLPVCASRVGGLQGIVRHGETGLLFSGGSSAELALHLERLLDDDESRYRMGEAGRARAEAEYDWSSIIRKHYPPLLERLAS